MSITAIVIYVVIGTLAATFMHQLMMYKYPHFDLDTNHWKKPEYMNFWMPVAGFFWPITIPLGIGIAILISAAKIADKIIKALNKMWAYLIKEVVDPKNNVRKQDG